MLPNTFDRRDFLKLSAAGVALAGLPGLAGCAAPPDREPPLELSRRASSTGNAVNTFSMHPRIKQDAMSDLRRALAEFGRTGGVLTTPYPGVHFARIALLEEQQQLVLAVIYDRSRRTAINFLVENGARLDRVLRFCQGYAPGAALDPVKLNSFRLANRVDNKLFFTAYNTAEEAVRESLTVRARTFSTSCALRRGSPKTTCRIGSIAFCSRTTCRNAPAMARARSGCPVAFRSSRS